MKKGLSELMLDLAKDLRLQRAYAKSPATVMKKYGLTAAEKRALKSGHEPDILDALGGPPGFVIRKFIVKYHKPKRRPAK